MFISLVQFGRKTSVARRSLQCQSKKKQGERSSFGPCPQLFKVKGNSTNPKLKITQIHQATNPKINKSTNGWQKLHKYIKQQIHKAYKVPLIRID